MASVSRRISSWVGATTSTSLQGLAGYSIDVPEGDVFSPFGQEVAVDRYLNTPLHQYTDGWTAHLGTTLNKDLSDWRLSLTDAFDHADSQTDTDAGLNATPLQALLNSGSITFNPFAPTPGNLIETLPQAYARSITDSANIQFLANGPVVKLPAGNFYVSG